MAELNLNAQIDTDAVIAVQKVLLDNAAALEQRIAALHPDHAMQAVGTHLGDLCSALVDAGLLTRVQHQGAMTFVSHPTPVMRALSDLFRVLVEVDLPGQTTEGAA